MRARTDNGELIRRGGGVEKKRKGGGGGDVTILFLKEMTTNWAFFVRSLM